MKKVIYVLLGVLVIVGIIRVVYEYRFHKEELDAVARFERRQFDVKLKGAPAVQKLAAIQEVEKAFYPKLTTCTPVNIASEDGTNYVIFGKDGNKCSFEKYSVSYCLSCLVPMDVAKKYAISGGSTKEYVDEINNNPEYCKLSFEGPKIKVQKKKNKNQDNK